MKNNGINEQVTIVEILLPRHMELELLLHDLFPTYEINYSAFTDVWEFRNKKVIHSITKYRNKLFELKTVQRNEYKEIYVFSFLFLIFFGIIFFLNHDSFLVKYDGIFFVIMILFPIARYFLQKMKPKYKIDFNKSHNSFVQEIRDQYSA